MRPSSGSAQRVQRESARAMVSVAAMLGTSRCSAGRTSGPSSSGASILRIVGPWVTPAFDHARARRRGPPRWDGPVARPRPEARREPASGRAAPSRAPPRAGERWGGRGPSGGPLSGVEARAVDRAVEAVAELAADNRSEQRDQKDGDERDDATRGGGAVVDR